MSAKIFNLLTHLPKKSIKKNPQKKSHNYCIQSKITIPLQPQKGGLAEWSMAAVLKTVVRQRTGGSNPSASAKN